MSAAKIGVPSSLSITEITLYCIPYSSETSSSSLPPKSNRVTAMDSMIPTWLVDSSSVFRSPSDPSISISNVESASSEDERIESVTRVFSTSSNSLTSTPITPTGIGTVNINADESSSIDTDGSAMLRTLSTEYSHPNRSFAESPTTDTAAAVSEFIPSPLNTTSNPPPSNSFRPTRYAPDDTSTPPRPTTANRFDPSKLHVVRVIRATGGTANTFSPINTSTPATHTPTTTNSDTGSLSSPSSPTDTTLTPSRDVTPFESNSVPNVKNNKCGRFWTGSLPPSPFCRITRCFPHTDMFRVRVSVTCVSFVRADVRDITRAAKMVDGISWLSNVADALKNRLGFFDVESHSMTVDELSAVAIPPAEYTSWPRRAMEKQFRN
ncbi:hypothetical protein BLNAU_8224 [Blattamonas nauphoetae]|uniref:Uncharacterized protein n=1 Tax=Blattamonas nauphoetae TaxID=2049346 RepID=A0ABQ9XZ59_9EUKA|nr:hypothetical protein BLNAU_8224 [Blattamonas nauphoetae]